MELERACDDELARRLPLPLARLYRRALNAHNALERHNAAFYLWEAGLKLLGAAAIAAYGEGQTRSPAIDERLKVLPRAAVGHWWEIVRLILPVLADGGESETSRGRRFADARDLLLGPTRHDLPRASGLLAALQAMKGGAAGSKSAVKVFELFNALVQYRNEEIGHGAQGLRPGEFHDRMGRALLGGLSELFGRLDVLGGGRLISVDAVKRLPSGDWQVERTELSGDAGRRVEPWAIADVDRERIPRPERVYVEAPAGEGGALRPLHPLVLFDPETSETFFLNGHDDRGKTSRTDYLCYATGGHTRRVGLGDDLRELLGHLLRAPVTREEAEAWAARAAPEGATPPSPPVDPDRQHVGEYELVSELGRGGMGIVYRAWQPSLGRQVALKCLLRAGDPKAEARFTREIHALGRVVDHPNLVRTFTTGSDGDRWFYAMELVEGTTLAEVGHSLGDRGSVASDLDLETWRSVIGSACEQAREKEKPLGPPTGDPSGLGPRQTLASRLASSSSKSYVRHAVELVRQVAGAAHALNEAGVVHRDIKPGNIMVTPDGAQAVLIDLGLAHLVDHGKLTLTQQFVGTPRYASPEQIVDSSRVDRRTDVYSLGATLWELLTLHPIFDATEGTPDFEVKRRIVSQEPARVRKHHKGIAEDLEAIVLKCLEKDPADRYPTAAALADDLGRWLDGEVVLAQPLTLRYWAGKLVRRNRVPLAVAAVFVALIGGWIGRELMRIKYEHEVAVKYADDVAKINRELERSNVGLKTALIDVETQRNEADRQKSEAVTARAKAEEASRRAERAAEKAETISSFLIDGILAQAAPENNPRQRKVTVEEALDRAATLLDSALLMQPDVKSAVRLTIGLAYGSLGQYAKAETQFRSAWQTRRRALGDDHEDTLSALSALADSLHTMNKWVESETHRRQLVEARRKGLGPENALTLRERTALANTLIGLGKFDEAETTYREILAIRRRLLGANHLLTLQAMSNLATALGARGKPAEEQVFRDTVAGYTRVLGAEHTETLSVATNLADALFRRGKLDEAETRFRTIIDVRRRVLGSDHPVTLRTMNHLAMTLLERGKLDESAKVSRAVLDASRDLGDDHLLLMDARSKLAIVLLNRNQLDEAEALQRQALGAVVGAVGEEREDSLVLMNDMAVTLLRRAKFEEAEALSRRVIAIGGRTRAPEFGPTLVAMMNLATALEGRGQVDEPVALLRRVVELSLQSVGSDHRQTTTAMRYLALSLSTRGKAADLAEAEPLCQRAVEINVRVLGPDHIDTLAAEGTLGFILIRRGAFARAEPLLRRVVETSTRVLGAAHSDTLSMSTGLIQALVALGKLDEAEPLCLRVIESARRAGGDRWTLLIPRNTLGLILQRRGRFAEAEPIQREVVETLRARFSETNRDLMSATFAWSNSLQALGRFSEAAALQRRIVETLRRASGPEHPETLNVMQSLVVSLLDAGKPAEAVADLRALLKARRRLAPLDLAGLANTLSPLGWALTETGEPREAEPILREALRIRRLVMPGHWAVGSTETLLGRCLSVQGRHAEAEPLLLEGWTTLSTNPATPPLRYRQALDRIIALYDAWSRPEKAKPWRGMRLDLDVPADPFAR